MAYITFNSLTYPSQGTPMSSNAILVADCLERSNHALVFV